MFSFNIFDSSISFTAAIISTIIVSFVFLKMSFSYTKKRARKRYADGKLQVPSMSSFKNLSKLLFMSSMLLTLTSFWVSSSLFLTFHAQPVFQSIGVALVLFGYINLHRAFNNLGDNYSPLFDAYLPSSLVTTGSYRFIRHPIYLFNLFVSFGLAISSGSGIVVINATIGLLFILKTISIEEAYLKSHFDNYLAYSKNSWRLVPFLY